ncbi:hypothetical protein BDZ97DRAFT_780425 [Flammula alnicola]|nr:hypothetical protein BDZ97DRAFT_780425 [Flammula alnicola]
MATVSNTTIPPTDVPTPLIFLPPHLVHEVLVATYIHLGTISVLVWDIINNLRNDFHLLSSFRLGIPTCIYITTRISLLAYGLGRTVLLTAPVENCTKFENALNSLLAVFMASTTCFFYIRICTLYAMNKYIVAFFGMLWLSTVAMSATFSRTFAAEHIGSTQYCIEKVHGNLLGPTANVLLVNAVLVYLAITYKSYCTFIGTNSSVKVKTTPLFLGISLPVLSKVVLLDTQLYCLIIVLTNAVLVFTISAFDPPTSTAPIIFHLVLTNVLSGRIYRDIKGIGSSDFPTITQVEFELSVRRNGAHPSFARSTGERTSIPDLDPLQYGNANLSTHSSTRERLPAARNEKRSSPRDPKS